MTRQEAIRELKQWRDQMKSHGVPDYGKKLISLELAIDILEQDCVEIVRCKDCKHWGGVILGNKCTMLSGLDYVLATKENDFCSFGERKESEE